MLMKTDDLTPPAPPAKPKPTLNDHAKMWVRALRSGLFQKAEGTLRKSNGVDKFCCLGVACEVYQMATGDDVEHTVKASGTHYYGGDSWWLPEKVRAWLGLTDIKGSFAGDEIPGTPYRDGLTKVNDSPSTTFAEIADIIERYPEQLFVKPGTNPGEV